MHKVFKSFNVSRYNFVNYFVTKKLIFFSIYYSDFSNI